jgi:hypothetical protein
MSHPPHATTTKDKRHAYPFRDRKCRERIREIARYIVVRAAAPQHTRGEQEAKDDGDLIE